jgi:hypothetical protein
MERIPKDPRPCDARNSTNNDKNIKKQSQQLDFVLRNAC